MNTGLVLAEILDKRNDAPFVQEFMLFLCSLVKDRDEHPLVQE